MLKALLVSEVTTQEKTASGAVLHRHKKSFSGKIIEFNDLGLEFQRPRWKSALLNRLKHVIPNIVDQYLFHYEPINRAKHIAKRIKQYDFDLIISLAHGYLGTNAWRIGKQLGIPNVVIFHDWWPDLLEESSPHLRPILKDLVLKDFLNCQKYADCCLAVSEGMLHNLASSNAVLLPPLPDTEVLFSNQEAPKSPFTAVYSGSLWEPYGSTITKLAYSFQNETNFRFKIFGSPKYIPRPTRENLIKKGILNNYISTLAYKDLIVNQADALIAVMGEPSLGSLRMQTSFPSKVATYFRTGKPVLLYAPESSALGKFCKDIDYPWWVKSNSIESMKEMLLLIKSNKTMWQKAQKDSINLGKTYFCPTRIQKIFESAIHQFSH